MGPARTHPMNWLDRQEVFWEQLKDQVNFKRTTLGKEVMRSAARSANVTATTAANKSKIVVLLDMWVQSRLIRSEISWSFLPNFFFDFVFGVDFLHRL